MAAEGANCSNSFTPWPVCTAARATMWTGVYPHQHEVIYKVYGMSDLLGELSQEKRTLFTALREGGYTIGYFGKWYLGNDDPGLFDEWQGFNSHGEHWVNDRRDGVYKPDRQTDQLIDFLRRAAEAGAEEGDRPFFSINGFYPAP